MSNNKKEIYKAILKTIGIIVATVLVLFASAFFQRLFEELDIEIIIILGSSSLLIILLLIVFIIFFISKKLDYKKYGKEYVLLEELIIFRLGISYSDFKVSKKIKRKLNYFIEDVDKEIEIFRNDINQFNMFLEEKCKELHFEHLFERYREKINENKYIKL